MWTQTFCLICIYILRNYAFQISNEALFLAFLQPIANRLKSFIPPSRRLGKTFSASTFTPYTFYLKTFGTPFTEAARIRTVWTRQTCLAGCLACLFA